MKDKKIICKDCGEEFEFSIAEQEFFKLRDFEDPKRCLECRRKRKKEKYSDTLSAGIDF